MSPEHAPLAASQASADDCRESLEPRDLEKGLNKDSDVTDAVGEPEQHLYFQETWRRMEKESLMTAFLCLWVCLMICVLLAIEDDKWRTIEKLFTKVVAEMEQAKAAIGSTSPL